ncbi:MAG: tRNA threonylcarbamoyladenosine dehydratase [Clostridia bacterium]
MEDDIYQRTKIVIGQRNIEKIHKSHVVICGIGGVGSYVLESLSRIGVGRITVVDKDSVDITNINRQIIATNKTVGLDKVEAAKNRVFEINPKIEVSTIKDTITVNNIHNIIAQEGTSYVVDCIDDIEAKIAIISRCYNQSIPCISCMGMGNKLNPLDIKVDDIYKTIMCPLAKIMRKRLKEIGIKRQKVIYSVESPKCKTEEEKINFGNTIGSVAFVPSVAGLIMSSEVIKDIIK